MSKHALSIAAVTAAVAIVGCGVSDPYQQHTTTGAAATGSTSTTPTPNRVQNPGEPLAPAPPSAASEAPGGLRATPERAITQFADLYINWTWQTLAIHQRQLARLSVGAARLAEQQAAAAAARDTTIAQTHIYNSGQITSIAQSATNPNQWVIVTHEQTGGNSQYDGLQPSYHVTLAELTKLPGGWAISQWLPQL